MKTRLLILAAPALFALGILVGWQFSPSPLPTPEESKVTKSSRSTRKNTGRRAIAAVPSGPLATDIPALLELVDVSDPFTTSTKLRASLGELSAGQLEILLSDLADQGGSHPGKATLQLSLVNHLIARDPRYALEVILNHKDRSFRTSYLGSVMKGLARLDLETAQAAVAEIEDETLRALAQTTLLSQQIDASPAELLALLESGANQNTAVYQPSYFHPFGYQYSWGSQLNYGYYGGYLQSGNESVIGQLARKDLPSAEAYAHGLQNESQRNAALIQIAGALAGEDPEQALDWARQQESPLVRTQALSQVINRIATDDPSRAAGMLGEIENAQQRASSISMIASQWAQTDPRQALAWADSLPPSQGRTGAYSAVVHQLVQTDPLAAVRVAERLGGSANQNLLPSVVGQWTARDFDAARNWVVSQNNPFQLRNTLPHIMNHWAQREPAAAAAYLQNSDTRLIGSSNLNSHVQNVSYQWATQDREAAMAWANSLENEAMRSSAISGIHNHMAASNPAEAAQHLTGVNDPDLRSQLVSNLASNWTNHDHQAAEAWLNTLGQEDRMRAAGAMMNSLQQQNPREAADLYDRLMANAPEDSPNRSSLEHQADNIADSWANHNPAEAADWAQSLESEDQRSDAYTNIVTRWAQFDPTGAAGWLDSLPEGSPRDQAVRSFANQIQQADPAAAFDWASTIGDDDTRYRSLQTAASNWRQSDPEAAREAVRQADLTEERREQILRQFE